MEDSLFPEEIELEILLRLPEKSLMRFKSVYKKWQYLIQSPSFINNYKNRKIGTTKLLLYNSCPISNTVNISSSLLHDYLDEKMMEIIPLPPFLNNGLDNECEIEEGFEFHRDVHILGPVNGGVYCIFHRLVEKWGGKLTLWNPTTRECNHVEPPITFPFPPLLLSETWNPVHSFELNMPEGLRIGFGLDPNNINGYKVVVIYQWREVYGPGEYSHVTVYDSASDSWKIIVSPEFIENNHPLSRISVLSCPEFTHCYLNGAYHWSCRPYYDVMDDDIEHDVALHQLITCATVYFVAQVQNFRGYVS